MKRLRVKLALGRWGEGDVLLSPPRALCLCGNALGTSLLGTAVTFHSRCGVLVLPRCQERGVGGCRVSTAGECGPWGENLCPSFFLSAHAVFPVEIERPQAPVLFHIPYQIACSMDPFIQLLLAVGHSTVPPRFLHLSWGLRLAGLCLCQGCDCSWSHRAAHKPPFSLHKLLPEVKTK